MVDAHIGDLGIAEVVMRDASGQVTDSYDTMNGIIYSSSNPSAVNVIDDDAEPKEEINVVPGEATGGEIKIRFTEQA